MSISIHRVEIERVVYVVAENGTWIPGVYDSEEAARAAVDLEDEVIERELGPIYAANELNRAVTLAEVQAVLAASEGVG